MAPVLQRRAALEGEGGWGVTSGCGSGCWQLQSGCRGRVGGSERLEGDGERTEAVGAELAVIPPGGGAALVAGPGMKDPLRRRGVFSHRPPLKAREGGIEVRNFLQLLFACPPRVLVGALCVPCAEVLLLEASGGWVTAPQFSRNFPQFFAIGFDVPGLQSPPPLISPVGWW